MDGSLSPVLDHVASIPVWRLGQGSLTLVVVHGGPGLDHRYMVDALRPLSAVCELVFYDQHHRSRNPEDQSIRSLTRDLEALIEGLGASANVGLLTHSWGAYLAYAALAEKGVADLRTLVLVSPVGLTKERFDESGDRLVSRLDESTLAKIGRQAEEGRDLDMMRTLFPYYLAQRSRSLACPVGWYSNALNEALIGALSDYDFTSVGRRLPEATLVVYGDEDIELPSATREVHDKARIEVLPSAGHFSFLEHPAEFCSLVRQFLSDGSILEARA